MSADKERFDRLKAAFEIVGFSADQLHTIERALSAILHLGNVFFKMDTVSNGSQWFKPLVNAPSNIC